MSSTLVTSLGTSLGALRLHGGQAIGALAALGAGLLLALMIERNGALAQATDPWLASWLAHGIGTLVAALLWGLVARVNANRRRSAGAATAGKTAAESTSLSTPSVPDSNSATPCQGEPVATLVTAEPAQTQKAPLWAWLGGLPGALTVVLAAFCLNSPLGMAGTLALLLLGQLLFGALCDALGWFGLPRRRPEGMDLFATFLVMAGALLIVLGP
ncbi:DMT family transporter [Aeromonas veronii]|uniref:DMT family transporter n=1 Tax=Aeromonas veronii TaxID=654 RepID=UPI0032EB712A